MAVERKEASCVLFTQNELKDLSLLSSLFQRTQRPISRETTHGDLQDFYIWKVPLG